MWWCEQQCTSRWSCRAAERCRAGQISSHCSAWETALSRCPSSAGVAEVSLTTRVFCNSNCDKPNHHWSQLGWSYHAVLHFGNHITTINNKIHILCNLLSLEERNWLVCFENCMWVFFGQDLIPRLWINTLNEGLHLGYWFITSFRNCWPDTKKTINYNYLNLSFFILYLLNEPFCIFCICSPDMKV